MFLTVLLDTSPFSNSQLQGSMVRIYKSFLSSNYASESCDNTFAARGPLHVYCQEPLDRQHTSFDDGGVASIRAYILKGHQSTIAWWNRSTWPSIKQLELSTAKPGQEPDCEERSVLDKDTPGIGQECGERRWHGIQSQGNRIPCWEERPGSRGQSGGLGSAELNGNSFVDWLSRDTAILGFTTEIFDSAWNHMVYECI